MVRYPTFANHKQVYGTSLKNRTGFYQRNTITITTTGSPANVSKFQDQLTFKDSSESLTDTDIQMADRVRLKQETKELPSGSTFQNKNLLGTSFHHITVS